MDIFNNSMISLPDIERCMVKLKLSYDQIRDIFKNVPGNRLILSQYSPKSLVIRPTENIFDTDVVDIIELGGKHQEYLKDGRGWIFYLSKKKELQRYLLTGDISFAKNPGEVLDEESFVNEIMYRGKEIRKKISIPQLKTEFLDDKYYRGWVANMMIYDYLYGTPSQLKYFKMSYKSETSEYVYGSPEMVEEWLGDRVGTTSLFGGKIGEYFMTTYVGD